MKKRLKWSLGVTMFIFLVWVLWDAFGDPTIWNASIFQPFPGLVLSISLILDLWFWYSLRQEKAQGITKSRKKEKSILDIIIIFLMLCLIAATCSYLFEYILVHY